MRKRSQSTWINTTNTSSIESWLDFFEEWVLKTPDNIALYFKEEQYSYSELNSIANWISLEIQTKVKDNNSFIGLSMSRSPLLLASMIGIHKAGKAYIPLDPDFPRERLDYMIADSGIKTIISDSESHYSPNIININCSNWQFVEKNQNNRTQKHSSRAYMLYTSGSTGKPKGVVIQHEALLNFLLSMKEEPGFSSNDTSLALTTITFDISGLELLLPLIAGGSVHLVDSEAIYKPKELVRTINSSSISLLQATPTVLKVLIDQDIPVKKGLKILSGGEPLSKELSNTLIKTGNPIWNMYGPTETTIWSSLYQIPGFLDKAPTIGEPIANTGFHILNEEMKPVTIGETGQLWISGKGLAERYWNNPQKTSEQFKIMPGSDSLRIYGTGDFVFEDESGLIRFAGRKDNQVKIRGLRIELEDIENAVQTFPNIKDSVITVDNDAYNNATLICHYTSRFPNNEVSKSAIRQFLLQKLPAYMIPTHFIKWDDFPRTLNNKIDRKALSEPEKKTVSIENEAPNKTVREILTNHWQQALSRSDFSEDENFFDLGGHSLLVIYLTEQISHELGQLVEPLFFFENPTLRSQIEALDTSGVAEKPETLISTGEEEDDDFSLAIIGLSCEVPGASNADEFWELLSEGRSGIKDLSEDQLIKKGIDPDVLSKPEYVRRCGSIESSKYFDHTFFGYSPNEARYMDPQHRLMLEHSYKAFESAGIIIDDFDGKIGVFASCGQNQYVLKNLLLNQNKEEWSDFQTMIGNENDFLATRIAYKLNLKGPALTVQTACSSSLVAIQLAYQSLINHQCDMALCGGVSLNLPMDQGYLFEEGSIFSPDGVCRAFDKNASGTIFGSGIGTILLKRLSEAKKDNDPIIAVIRSAAINNDGSNKIGYTAPSIQGQSEVIEEAINLAEISPNDISYVEAHGTGTRLGDPIEIAALSKAINKGNDRIHPCYIGSVKSNIGHLDAAAGIVGLIKTALSLKKNKIPPSINYSQPNPELHIENTPFQVNTELRNWPEINGRKIAGISSFGIGGTNAHVILEAPPIISERVSELEHNYLYHPISSKTANSLSMQLDKTLRFLNETNTIGKLNTAYTLKHKRKEYKYKSFILSDLKNNSEIIGPIIKSKNKSPKTVYLLPGQSDINYEQIQQFGKNDVNFKANIEYSLSILEGFTGWDATDLLLKKDLLDKTEYLQPLLFCIEWAIGKTILDYGVPCDFLIGHSLGEITAASLSGAMDLETGIKITVKRGELMSLSPLGKMIAVRISLDELKGILIEGIEISAVNGSHQVVLSGTPELIKTQKKILDNKSIDNKLINNRYAFHSSLMHQASKEFQYFLESITFNPLSIPIISNVYGEVLDKGFIYTSDYWSRHLIESVRFYQSIEMLNDIESLVLIDLSPDTILKNTLKSSLIKRDYEYIEAFKLENLISIPALIKTIDNTFKSDLFTSIDKGNTIPLPGYCFERHDHWIDPFPGSESNIRSNLSNSNKIDLDKNVKSIILEKISETLGIIDIDSSDNFLSIGGDSLSAGRITNKINKSLGTSIPISLLLENPILDDFISLANTYESNNSIKELSNSRRTDISNLSSSQKRLWFINELYNNNYAYNLCLSLEIQEEIDFKVLSKTLEIITSRHDIFRSKIIKTDNEPQLVFDSKAKINITTYLCKEYSRDAQLAEINKEIKFESKRHFDFQKAPVNRFVLYQASNSLYYLVLYIPHIFIDGWSFSVFKKEFKLTYSSLIKNEILKLPDVSQYSSYINKEKKSINKNTDLLFWKEHLKDFSSQLEFPYDNPRSSGLELYSGNTIEIVINSQISKKISQICTEIAITPFTFFISTLHILFSIFTSKNDITIGYPFANRNDSDFENTIGLFVNMFPLRAVFSSSTTFRELLLRNKSCFNKSLNHTNIQFGELVNDLNLNRQLNEHPIFQIIMAYQNYKSDVSSDLNIKEVFLNRGISEYDFSFYFWEEENQYKGALEYSKLILNDSTIENLLDVFYSLIDKLSNSIDQPIKSISKTTERMDSLILKEWNNTYINHNLENGYFHRFKEIVYKYPNNNAVICNSDSITYEQLDKRSNQIAQYLAGTIECKNAIIGIYLDRNIEAICTLLGVLKSGAAYLPLDSMYPKERLQYMIETSDTSLVLSSKSANRYFAENELNVPILLLDEIDEIIKSYPMSDVKLDNDPDDRAYIIFTSGSTGKPKGVQIDHKALLNLLLSMKKHLDITDSDRFLALTTFSFDISCVEVFLPLLCGAALVLTEQEMTKNVLELGNYINKQCISIMQATPATYKMLFEIEWKPEKNIKIITGGEALSKDLASKMLSISSEVWNGYGPTESTIYSSLYKVIHSNIRPPIGKPIANTKYYILDKKLKPVPIGVFGELYIGGIGLSRGYINRDNLTNERFINNPFSELSNEKIYKTGDICRYLSDGNVEYQGRDDQQVKLRGFRIELEEIEFHVNSYSNIINSVCIIHSYSETDSRLIAYIKSESLVDFESLRDYLSQKIPYYMIPDHFQMLEEFPLNSSRKIDKSALPIPDFSNKKETDFIEAQSSMEFRFLKIWQDVLKKERISLNDNFFLLGGHSLLAIQLLYRINKEFNSDLTLFELFSNPTIQSLIISISDNNKPSNSNLDLIFPINKGTSGLPFFLIPGIYNEMYYSIDNKSAYEKDFLRYFNNIIVYLKSQIPVYGLRPRGIYRGERFQKNVYEMANEYIKEIKKIQKSGPYRIGGECLGGILALEIVKQLEEKGEYVERLVLFDTYKLNSRTLASYMLGGIKQKIKKVLHDSRTVISPVTEGKIKSDIVKNYQSLFNPFIVDHKERRELFFGDIIYKDILLKSKPPKLQSETLLIINEEWNRKYTNLGWSSKDMPNLDIRIVNGNHSTKLTEYGEDIGKLLRQYLLKK